MLYGIDVHTYFPPTMYTPGYDEENKTKPEISKVIESDDEGLTADQAARAMFEGWSILIPKIRDPVLNLVKVLRVGRHTSAETSSQTFSGRRLVALHTKTTGSWMVFMI